MTKSFATPATPSANKAASTTTPAAASKAAKKTKSTGKKSDGHTPSSQSRVRWDKDGRPATATSDAIPSSYEILRHFLRSEKTIGSKKHGFYELWKGAAKKGVSKASLAKEVVDALINAVTDKIANLETKYKAAIKFRGETGAGLLEAEVETEETLMGMSTFVLSPGSMTQSSFRVHLLILPEHVKKTMFPQWDDLYDMFGVRASMVPPCPADHPSATVRPIALGAADVSRNSDREDDEGAGDEGVDIFGRPGLELVRIQPLCRLQYL